MKTIILFALLLVSQLLMAVTFEVSIHANRFDPEVVVIQSGDTVNWTVINGTHSLTSTQNNQNIDINSPVLNPNSVYSQVFTGSGGEISYSSSADNSGNMTGAVLIQSVPSTYTIDERINAAFYDPETSGQGILFEYVPSTGQLVAYWFTYNKGGQSQQWFIAQGITEGNRATLQILEPLGGKINDPQPITAPVWGELSIEFSDCSNAHVWFNASDEGHSGNFPLSRLYLSDQCQ